MTAESAGPRRGLVLRGAGWGLPPGTEQPRWWRGQGQPMEGFEGARQSTTQQRLSTATEELRGGWEKAGGDQGGHVLPPGYPSALLAPTLQLP